MNQQAQRLFERLPERVRKHLRPSLVLRTAATPLPSLALGESRIGGAPDLPEGFSWPVYDGLPMSFVAQLDLAVVASHAPVLDLPESGSLAFFYDSEQRTWGYDPKHAGSSFVAYFHAASTLVRTPLPDGVPRYGRFDCCSVSFEPDENLPDRSGSQYRPPLSDEEWPPLRDFLRAKGETGHRLGGHADCVQNPMELECQLVTNGLYCGNASGYNHPRAAGLAAGALDWRLLLQIDSDDNAGMMWGDVGTIYYWIREQDLAARRFEKSWLVFQCC